MLSLRRIDTSKPGADDRECGEFLHMKGEKIYDFDLIRKEIENRTDYIAGD